MKRFLLTTALVLAFAAPARADDLNTEDMTWLVKVAGAMRVTSKCSQNYELDFPGMMTWGDQNGADTGHLATAILAFMKSLAKQDYDRSDIDPRVTRAYIKVSNGLDELEQAQGKQKLCKQFTEWGLRDGFIKPK